MVLPSGQLHNSASFYNHSTWTTSQDISITSWNSTDSPQDQKDLHPYKQSLCCVISFKRTSTVLIASFVNELSLVVLTIINNIFVLTHQCHFPSYYHQPFGHFTLYGLKRLCNIEPSVTSAYYAKLPRWNVDCICLEVRHKDMSPYM